MKITEIQFAGHSAVLLKTDTGKVIGIDPWLEGNPVCPDQLKELSQLDLVVLTHGHADHASDVLRLAKSLGSEIIATYELVMLLIKEGVPENQGLAMNKGGTINWNGLSVSLTHAFHSSSYETANGTAYAGEACGVVIRDGAQSIYHAGDTALFKDMKLIKKEYKPTIAFLPIGDRFTMNPAEAARAADWVGCNTAIPIHHSTFPLLTGTPEEFQAACNAKEVECLVLEPGQTHALS